MKGNGENYLAQSEFPCLSILFLLSCGKLSLQFTLFYCLLFIYLFYFLTILNIVANKCLQLLTL